MMDQPAQPTGAQHTGRGRLALRVILAASIVSTAIHYADNYVQIDRYPQPAAISESMTRVAIVVFWPLLTAVGLLGYRLFTRGRYWPARGCLLVYSLTGLVTLGHFLNGVPDVPWYWFTTLFTDAAAGLALWIFAGWSLTLDETRSPVARNPLSR